MGGDPAAIREAYRTRFGIESSYRQLGQVRRRTSTADGVIRLLWVAVGLLLRNARVRHGRRPRVDARGGVPALARAAG